MLIDPVKLSCDLINCPSITPSDAGVIDVLVDYLSPLGFTYYKLPSEDVLNLYACIGNTEPNFCFAGHTDVVPPGNEDEWIYNPFIASIKDGYLYGRGAVDMKPAIACFIAATSRILQDFPSFHGSISLMITGDEEGVAINGTKKILNWLKERKEVINACIVGEPTNPNFIGEMIKIGRRGSISFELSVQGIQGHVAYPHLANNPIHSLVQILNILQSTQLDQGNEFFDPSNLEITSIDVNNPAKNVIPSIATANFNIRFNNIHTGNQLIEWVKSVCQKNTNNFQLKSNESAVPFLTENNILIDLFSNSIKEVTQNTPIVSTTGGTSDARFIKDFCPVIEFGLINKTAHKPDENTSLNDIKILTEIYYLTIKKFFGL